ncbi:hypothetical protein Pla8534_21370 [Lignipirellula cremea]|uniref:Uncharacterized protein n=1 Tax=Lignipirellula cremea TaxID=2528010 RepID=A0A518DR82_9BACT|nr:hypothetical protein Pla8534_21370 [Lignipirellula cremea]
MYVLTDAMNIDIMLLKYCLCVSYGATSAIIPKRKGTLHYDVVTVRIRQSGWL